MLEACGYGRFLLVGDLDPRLVCELRRLCALVETCEGWPEVASAISSAADGAGGHDVLVLTRSGTEVPFAAGVVQEALRRAGKAVCVLAVAQEPIRTGHEEVEMEFFKAGARRHPGIAVVSDFGRSPDAPDMERWWLFERVPSKVARAHPAKRRKVTDAKCLDPTRIVGGDGRRPLVRYVSAAGFIRPGDRVLDVACSGGAGPSWISALTRASSVTGLTADVPSREYAEASFAKGFGVPVDFRVGCPDDLSSIGDGTVDFCIGIDASVTSNLDAFLASAYRILCAGGRLYVGISLGRGSEARSGEGDIQGQFLGAYTGIMEAIGSSGFMLEHSWLQAFGTGACVLREFDRTSKPSGDPGDWCLALLMKSPLSGGSSTTVGVNDIPNILSFERDYAYPALVRSMVSIGLRTTSPELLERMADETLQRVPFDSADAGAALCVKLYLHLEPGTADDRDDDALLAQVSRYIDGAEENPTGYRWRVSLAYANGLYWQVRGVPVRAKAWLSKAAWFDAARFSPLLGTKTIGAAVLLGQIALAESESSAAQVWWRRALTETRRIVDSLDWSEVLGCEQAPETFGMPELALVMLQGARAAAGLRAMSEGIRLGPQGLWRMLDASLDGQLQAREVETAILRESVEHLEKSAHWYEDDAEAVRQWATKLEGAKGWLESQMKSLTAECDRQEAAIDGLVGQQRELKSSKDWLASQVESLTAECDRREAAINGLVDQQRELQSSKDWLASQVESLTAECDRREAALAGMDYLPAKVEWLEGQVASWRSEAEQQVIGLRNAQASLEATLKELQVVQHAKMEMEAWLQGQIASLNGEVGRLGSINRDLFESKQWLEDQYYVMVATLKQSNEAYDSAFSLNAELSGSNRKLSEALESVRHAAAKAQIEISRLNEEIRLQEALYRADVEAARTRIEYLEINPIKRIWMRIRSGGDKQGA